MCHRRHIPAPAVSHIAGISPHTLIAGAFRPQNLVSGIKQLDRKCPHRRFSFSLRAFLTVALSRKNLKNYLFTGTLLLSVAFLTPLKGLYLAFGCLSLVLALLTLTPLGENEGGGSGLGGLAGDDEEYTRIPRTPSEPTNEE